MKSAKHEYTILKQICQHIPAHLVPKLALSFGIDRKARSISPWSILLPCYMSRLRIVSRSMTWLIHYAIILEF